MSCCSASPRELLTLDLIDDLLARALMIQRVHDDPIPFELAMIAHLSEEFQVRVRELLSSPEVQALIASMANPANHVTLEGVGQQVAGDLLEEFHAIAGVHLGDDFAAAVRSVVGEEIEALYRASRQASGSPLGLAADAFSLVDQQSVTALHNNSMYWIQGNYSRNVREGIERATAEAIAGGQGRVALAEELQRRFRGQFDLTDNHWTTISSASLNRSRNIAQIRTYQEAEVTHYTINAVLDRRTSEICNSMDGRTFSVASAVRVITEVENAGDPEAVKDSMPWLRWDGDRGAPYAEVRGQRIDLPAGRSPADNAAYERVAPLPPYHGRCRSTTTVSVETVVS